ncbi:MAG: hypothetical protein ACJ8GW_04685 [Massilia sp.]
MKFLAFLLCLSPLLANAAIYKTGPVVLLQPEAVLQSKELSAAAVGEYMRAGDAAAAAVIKAAKLPPSGGFLVFAIRADGKTNAWTDFAPPLPRAVEEKLVKSLRALPAFHVASGSLLIAQKVTVNGGPEPVTNLPNPAAWRAAAAGLKAPMPLEELVERAWP